MSFQDVKIYAASAVGLGSPATNWFLTSVEPVIHILLLLGQLGVAVVTILYIYSKWKKLRNDKKDDNEDSD